MVTTENAGHSHTITDPTSGYTDISNGHRHKLSTGCGSCDKIRKTVLGKKTTTFAKGHWHFWEEKHDEL